jgi:hypothetical protein
MVNPLGVVLRNSGRTALGGGKAAWCVLETVFDGVSLRVTIARK